MSTPGSEAAVAERAAQPLDELMLAMDVVDTLRHRELVLARELEADDRDERLLERLREIYTGQGIAVTDEVLAQGVKALREERFVYAGPKPSFARTLATLYVTRRRWGPLAGAAAVIVLAVALVLGSLGARERRQLEALPAELAAAYQTVVAGTTDAEALADAQATRSGGEAAIAVGDRDRARTAVARLEALDRTLQQQYELRIVSRPGEYSAVFRSPDDNPFAENYYLIVEPIAPDGDVVEINVVNEETGQTRRVPQFGLRVDQETYQRVGADKTDDGIIQQNIVGTKRRGALEHEYSIATTGGTITEW